MSEISDSNVDENSVNRLLKRILYIEHKAIQKGTLDSEVIKEIKQKIEEEVECNSNN